MSNDFSALLKTIIVSIWDVVLIALETTWPAASQQSMFFSVPEAGISSNNKEKSKKWSGYSSIVSRQISKVVLITSDPPPPPPRAESSPIWPITTAHW